MNKNELIQTVRDMIAAASCCAELKQAGQNYLNAATPEAKKAAADVLVKGLHDSVATLDEAIGFYESPMALEIFGAELRQEKLECARKRKAAGEKWCDCPACAAGLRILEHVELL